MQIPVRKLEKNPKRGEVLVCPYVVEVLSMGRIMKNYAHVARLSDCKLVMRYFVALFCVISALESHLWCNHVLSIKITINLVPMYF